MKKIITLLLITTSLVVANVNVIVSILPQKTFVSAIGGDKVSISLMVLPGNSPHTYEPKPSQMKTVSNAKLYFAIGVEFERVWLPKFKSLNSDMTIVDLTKGIKKIEMAKHNHGDHDHAANKHGTKHNDEDSLDPHVWTSPANVKLIAKNILDALSSNDPKNANYYKANYNKFIEKINNTDEKIKEILSAKAPNSKFMVFHPSWGYFAKTYHLKQLAVEIEGKSPKPRELIYLLKEAEEENITAIFTQPEFSDAVAKVMARELEIKVIKVTPLAENWSENLINIAKAIAN